jgi:chitodextrinase
LLRIAESLLDGISPALLNDGMNTTISVRGSKFIQKISLAAAVLVLLSGLLPRMAFAVSPSYKQSKAVEAGSGNTVSLPFSSATTTGDLIVVHEYAGIDKTNPLDGASSGVGTSAATNSGNVTTTGSNDLLFTGSGAGGAVGTPPTGWTTRLNTSGNRTADKIVTSAGTYNATNTATGSAWVMQLVAFKADTGVDSTAPTAPASLTATAASSTQVGLSWPAATDNVGVTGYQVERCQGASCTTFAPLATVGAGVTTYNDTNLAPSTTYRYRVRATDAAGNLGAYSAVATATTQGVPDTTAPSVPNGLSGTGTSISQINLSWTAATDNVGVTGYKVYRNGAQVGTSATNSFQNSGLAVNTSYSYTVSAYDAAGNNSAQSTAVSVSTLPDTTAPSVPANLSAQAVSPTQVTVSWNASTDNVGVAGYKIYRDGAYLTTATGTLYQDLGLTAGATYSYTVSSLDAAGNESATTGAVQATTLVPDTTAPIVSITAPAPGGTVSGTVAVSANASDTGSGVHDVQFYLEGSPVNNDTTAPYSFQWNTVAVQNGTYHLTAVATDNAGNVSAVSDTITVTVNNVHSTVPNPLKIMPLGDSLTQGGVNGSNGGTLDPTTINGYRLELWNQLTSAGYGVDYVGEGQLGNSLLPDQDENGESGACIMMSPCGGGTMYPKTANWITTEQPDVVIMQGGANDYSHSISDEQNTANMESWIQLVWATKPDVKIIVTGVPYHPAYDTAVRDYVYGLQAQGKQIRWITYDNIDRIDSTHPNAAGYITWGDELASLVEQFFPL